MSQSYDILRLGHVLSYTCVVLDQNNGLAARFDNENLWIVASTILVA